MRYMDQFPGTWPATDHRRKMGGPLRTASAELCFTRLVTVGDVVGGVVESSLERGLNSDPILTFTGERELQKLSKQDYIIRNYLGQYLQPFAMNDSACMNAKLIPIS